MKDLGWIIFILGGCVIFRLGGIMGEILSSIGDKK